MKKDNSMKTKNKKRSSKSKAAKEPKKEKILKAAKKVFSLHPYASASMRMIAREARIDHPLIIYYFPTKADLFQKVLMDLKEEYANVMPGWFQGLNEMRVTDAVSTYLDRALSFHREHPEILRVILLNMTQSVGKSGLMPGYQEIQSIFGSASAAKVFRQSSRFNIKPKQMSSIIKGMSIIMTNLVGAREYHAEIQGLDPDSDAYFKWVKEVIMFMIIPVLKSFELKE